MVNFTNRHSSSCGFLQLLLALFHQRPESPVCFVYLPFGDFMRCGFFTVLGQCYRPTPVKEMLCAFAAEFCRPVGHVKFLDRRLHGQADPGRGVPGAWERGGAEIRPPSAAGCGSGLKVERRAVITAGKSAMFQPATKTKKSASFTILQLADFQS